MHLADLHFYPNKLINLLIEKATEKYISTSPLTIPHLHLPELWNSLLIFSDDSSHLYK